METLVCRRGELYPTARKVVQLGSEKVIVGMLRSGEMYAVADACPHHGASILMGSEVNNCLVCPWHYWHIDVRTGDVAGWPTKRLSRYELVERDGNVYVSFAAGPTDQLLRPEESGPDNGP